MQDESSPFSAVPDSELGAALREALAPSFHEAFVGRVGAHLGSRARAGWDDELSRWFWQGLVAASLAIVAAGWSWTRIATPDTSEASVASALLDGSQPVADIVIASMNQDTP